MFFASSTPLNVNTFPSPTPSMGNLRGVPPVASTNVPYGTRSPPEPTTTVLFAWSIEVTSVPVRRTTPYFFLSSSALRHSSLDGSVTRALLSFVRSIGA